MRALRSDRTAALLLIAAAVLGLVLANSPLAPAVLAVRDAGTGIPVLGLHLSVGEWVSEGLLSLFFLLAAIELRHELTRGELDTPRTALVPVVAALCGVAVPALLFLAIARDPVLQGGWPIPTATDIAFALGALSVVGRGLPGRVRSTLLALAVIDDLVAIVLIAVLFTPRLEVVPLLVAVPVVAAAALISTRTRGRAVIPLTAALVVLGVLTWLLVHASGVHATIAGVALGLVLDPRTAERARRALEPWTNAVVLPLFALSAALIPVPDVGASGLGPVFWAVVVALPLGKLVGIGVGAAVASRAASGGADRLSGGDVVVIGSLGGIGFTISLLLAGLAFGDAEDLRAQATLGVLAGSAIAIVLGVAVTVVRTRRAGSGPAAD